MPPIDPSTSPSFIALPVLQPVVPPEVRVDYDGLRRQLAAAKGRDYWRCLEELAQTDEFTEFVKQEFPRDAEVWNEPISRRTFLKLMSASLALMLFSGCRRPLEKIIPYNEAPEDLIPGKP